MYHQTMLNNEYKVLNQININSLALLHNFQYFAKLNAQAKIAPVLKSNAYGHGLGLVASFIDQNLSAPIICVDSLYEAYELYKLGIKSDILIMGYTLPDNYKVWKCLPFIFGISDIDSLKTLNKYQPNARIHIKLDTGMNRLGITQSQLLSFLQTLQTCTNLKVEGIFSHFSQADDPSKTTFTNRQIATFKKMTSTFEKAGYNFAWRHIAATSGAETLTDPYFNLIRLGLGFYGYSPFGPHTKEGRRQRQNLHPALTLETHLALIKLLDNRDSVGYGGTYHAKQKETMAILPLGYNEGISRDLSNQGNFYLPDGTACPIIGRISMNMTTIKLPRPISSKVGDPIFAPSIYEQAQLLHTIPYTILTSLHPSIRRILI